MRDTAPAPTIPDASTGYWKFTQHRVAQAARIGRGGASEGFVSSLDPDASSREGKKIAPEDAVRVQLFDV